MGHHIFFTRSPSTMKLFPISAVALFCAELSAARSVDTSFATADSFQDFEEIATFSGRVDELDLKPQCTHRYNGDVASVAFTVKPVEGTVTKVSSSSPNAIKVALDGRKLKTYYTEEALGSSITSAGVLIEIPSGSLEEVEIGGVVTATILEGFGSQLEKVQVTEKAKGHVTVTSSGKMELETDNDSPLNAIVTGKSKLEVDAEDNSVLVVKGYVTDGEVEDTATLKFGSGSEIEDHRVDAKDKSTVVIDPSAVSDCSSIRFKSSSAKCSTSAVSVNGVGDVTGSGTDFHECHSCGRWCLADRKNVFSNLRASFSTA